MQAVEQILRRLDEASVFIRVHAKLVTDSRVKHGAQVSTISTQQFL